MPPIADDFLVDFFSFRPVSNMHDEATSVSRNWILLVKKTSHALDFGDHAELVRWH